MSTHCWRQVTSTPVTHSAPIDLISVDSLNVGIA